MSQHDIPVEIWCLAKVDVDFLTRLFNITLETENMPNEWRKSVVVPVYKKGDV